MAPSKSTPSPAPDPTAATTSDRTSARVPIPADEPTERGVAVAAAANQPTPQDNEVTGGTGPRPVTPSPALYVSEGTRQDLLSGARAFDFVTGRELTLDGEIIRFATDAEIADRGQPGAAISTTDVQTLNPS